MWGDNAQMIKDLIDVTDESTVLEHNLHVRHPDSLAQGCWGAGRVTLVGDAAHPMRPASGVPCSLILHPVMRCHMLCYDRVCYQPSAAVVPATV